MQPENLGYVSGHGLHVLCYIPCLVHLQKKSSDSKSSIWSLEEIGSVVWSSVWKTAPKCSGSHQFLGGWEIGLSGWCYWTVCTFQDHSNLAISIALTPHTGKNEMECCTLYWEILYTWSCSLPLLYLEKWLSLTHLQTSTEQWRGLWGCQTPSEKGTSCHL